MCRIYRYVLPGGTPQGDAISTIVSRLATNSLHRWCDAMLNEEDDMHIGGWGVRANVRGFADDLNLFHVGTSTVERLEVCANLVFLWAGL